MTTYDKDIASLIDYFGERGFGGWGKGAFGICEETFECLNTDYPDDDYSDDEYLKYYMSVVESLHLNLRITIPPFEEEEEQEEEVVIEECPYTYIEYYYYNNCGIVEASYFENHYSDFEYVLKELSVMFEV